MLVNRIHEFIKTLVSNENKLGKVDSELLNAFRDRYANQTSNQNSLSNPEMLLDQTELSWIEKCFEERWKKVADKPEDYTFDPRGNNVPWVNLAKDLGRELNIPYLLILMPAISNEQDPEVYPQLAPDQDPRSIYLAEDGKTWRRIQWLFDRLQQPSSVLSTYDTKKNKPRALTLREMFRIRSKKGEELARQIDGEQYANFWDYLISKSAPNWKKQGKCSEQVLVALFELIDNYFNTKDTDKHAEQFNKQLKLLMATLSMCSLDDVNHFYSIVIHYNNKDHYLLNILLDCMQGTDDMSEKLAEVAKWLCHYDPSLVSKCKTLSPVYQQLQVGEYFSLENFKRLVAKLDLSVDGVRPRIEKLLVTLNQTNQITEDNIKELRSIYKLRWTQIIDKPDDYLRKQDGENRAWIRLAQYLAGAGYIDANYFKLLIPTLDHNIDLVTREHLTVYPLSHFILSDNGKQLIYLPNCILHHQSHRTFYNCSTRLPQALTTKEISRLPHAAKQFNEYYRQALDSDKADKPLSKSTILALKNLVNVTLNPRALELGYELTPEQITSADKAYVKLLQFVDKLPDDERERLYDHKIALGRKKQTVRELLEQAQLFVETEQKERLCVALASQYFAKLVIDYSPKTKFSSVIENSSMVDLADMRVCSANHVFRNSDNISQEEATYRALTIMVSLMTHRFSYIWTTGTQLMLWDESNTTTATGNELYNALKDSLEEGDLSNIRFIYTYTMRRIVDRALKDKNMRTKYLRYEDTLQWLTTIQDESMFKPENRTCFEPKLLLTVLQEFSKKSNNTVKFLIESFIEQLTRTLIQPENEYLQWIRINVEFNKLLKNPNISSTEYEKILHALRAAPKTPNEKEFVASLSHFLTERLARVGFSSKKKGLFGIDPGQAKSATAEITEFFEEQSAKLTNNEPQKKFSALEIVTEFKTMANKFTGRNAAMTRYLESLSILEQQNLKEERYTLF